MGLYLWLNGQIIVAGMAVQPPTPPAAPTRVRVSRVRAATTGTTITPPTNTRDALVPGTYRPDATTTGPWNPGAITTFQGDYTASSNGQTIRNLEIFGSVRLRSFSNVTIDNCIIHGTLVTGTQTAFVTADGDNLRGATIVDTRFEGRGNVWVEGMRGGGYVMRRVEVSGQGDGIGFTSQVGNATVEACWIHNGLFAEWTAAQNGTVYPNQGAYYTHNDGIQFHRGKNYTVRGCMIGGVRNPWGHHSGHAADINAGDDCYNAGIMLKQEVNNDPANKLENIVIENNWFEGGGACLNITSPAGDSTGPKNYFETVYIRNNRFPRSTWDDLLKTRLDTDGTVMDPLGQAYILRDVGLAVLSGNVFDDDGSAVPIRRGGNFV